MATSLATPEPVPSADHIQIGPYRILGSLGRGGMAEVFRAEHLHLGQIRALKILLPEISARPDIVGRLMTEARALGRMRHPVIVEVFDCDVLSDGTAFIAMEYVRGEALRSWFERVGKLTEHRLLAGAIVAAVGEGLAFAHQQGVVHRDLKPENVLLVQGSDDGSGFSVKILDFGVAKLLREEPLTTTRHGCVIGTPVYMAPEQWRPGSAIDHRADIYALGCLFFELLCGRPPFVEPDDLAMMRAHLEQTPPSAAALEEGLPAAWADLISSMLAKAPTDRPQSMEEVLVALESLLGRKRARWSELLRTPDGWSLTVEDAGAHREEPKPVAAGVRSPSRLRSPDLPSRWGRTGIGRDPRAQLALIASLGLVAAAGVVGAILLRAKSGEAKPPPPVAAQSAGAARMPAPPQTELRVFKVRVSSEPANAEVWVEGESTPRGRTPLDLVFHSVVPKVVQLVSPGWKNATVSISPVQARETAVRLIPEGQPEREGAARPRRDGTRPAARTPNAYQAVGD